MQRKNAWRIVSVALSMSVLLAACSSKTAPQPSTNAPAPKSTVTIKAMIRPDEGNNVAMYSQKFEEKTGIKVETTFVGWDTIHEKSVSTLAGGGGGYDIVFIPSADAAQFGAAGWFDNVDDVVNPRKAEFLPAVINLYSKDGHAFAVPWYSGGAHMAYNTEMIEKAGIKVEEIKTWDDFLAASRKVKAANAAPFAFIPSAKYPGNWYYNFGTMVAGFGGSFFDAKGEPTFETDGTALKAMKIIETGIKEGLFDPAGVAMDDYETLMAFMSGKSAFLLDSTWAVNQPNQDAKSTIAGKVKYMLVPGSDKVRSGGYIYAGGLGLVKGAPHPKEAKQFLDFLTQAEAQKLHATKGFNMPTLTALFKDAEINTAWKGFGDLAGQLQYGQFPPNVPFFGEFDKAAATAVQDVMAKRKSPEDAVKWLAAQAKEMKNR